MTTYPIKQAVSDAQLILKSPTQLARRFAEIVADRNLNFLSHRILTARYAMEGGALVYYPDEKVTADSGAETVTPGGEYPLITIGEDAAQIVAALKKGYGSIVTDEAVGRFQADPIDRTLALLANRMIDDFDALALSAIASAITQTVSGAAWTAGTQIIGDVAKAQASLSNLKLGYRANAVIVTETQWAAIAAPLLSVLPREAGNPVVGSGVPNIMGLDWYRSASLPAGWVPTVVDTNNLGGIGHEVIPSTEYAAVNVTADLGVEVARYREQNDSTRIQVRKVDVPFVRNPKAGIEITGTGL